eukprot:TRINITY_DN3497_c0_g1_i1.p1 TRINITY_DN3497_c0_g1~~TRINITY_DN3497_c0_g1_i1.p1  ORF type:complete len:440 (-),score=86.80 TRINITY_DN3497_c0_g1_i1:71-1348(-)
MEDDEVKFASDSSWRDLPFLFLFVLHFSGICVILGLGLTKPDVPPEDRLFNFSVEVVELLGILVGTAFLFSVLYLQLLRAFPRPMIYFGMGVSVLLFGVQAGYCFYQQNYFAGSLIIVFTVLYVLYLFLVRSRVAFAVEMIHTCVGLVHKFPGSQVTAFVSLIVQILWSTIWSYAVYHASTFDQTSAIIMSVFLLFSFYWVMEVIKNVVHVTVSGIVSTWYFLSGTEQMPSSPTFGSVKRAMTTSFGSICLGSLVVAIIKTLRAVLRSLSRNNSSIACIALMFLGCLDSLVRYFNHYAFCQVAIYGKTFIKAANDTWDLFQRSGIAQLANDNIIGGVLMTGSLLGASVVGSVGALIGLIAPQYGEPVVLFFVGFVIGFILVTLTMQVVDSAVSCLFVCFAEAPEALKEHDPELFTRFVEADTLIQ